MTPKFALLPQWRIWWRDTGGAIIGIHNHPKSSAPNVPDFNAAYARGYKYGVVVGHNGVIFKYSVKNSISEEQAVLVIYTLARLDDAVYNNKSVDQALIDLAQFGIDLSVIK